MAKPLPLILEPPQISNEADIREDLRRKLDEAPVEHAAAILSLYEFVETLHASGLLDILRGLAAANGEIIGRISSSLRSPEAVRGIRNLIALSQALGRIEPQMFDDLRDAINETARKNAHRNEPPPGLWKLAKKADSENSLRVLAAATDFLESFGKRLNWSRHSNGNSNHES